MEVASFEEVGFCLPKHAHVTQLGVGNPNQDDILVSKCDNKVVHRAPPRNDHDRRWIFGKNLLNIILHVKDVHVPRYGHVYSIESQGGVIFATYEVIIWVTLNCTCLDFVSMLTSLKKRGKFVPCKHMYFIYKTRVFVITKQMISLTNLH
jgi:hypothetical protein